MARSNYNRDVFINCPLDEQYKPFFEGLVFAVFDCGFRARCALEVDDASEVRIDKIFKIISACRYGIHDISRTEPDSVSALPRFNMPLELGIFLGAKRFGARRQQKKACLVLDRLPYRYQQFVSDIAGQDIQAHQNDPKALIAVVRNWLRGTSGATTIPGGLEIYRRYISFTEGLPLLCDRLKLDVDDVIFNDYALLISDWLGSA